MPRAATLLQAIFRAEPVVAASLTVVVGGVGVWVTPKAISALTPEPPPIGEVTLEGNLPTEREAIIQGLSALFENSYAFVGAQNASDQGPASFTLWLADEHDRGALNATEALIITHSALLKTITTTYLEPTEDPGTRVDYRDVTSTNAARRFRTYGTPTNRVIATGVQDLSITTTPATPGEVELALTLTWTASPDDANNEAEASATTLRVRLRRVEGIGR